MNVYIYWGVKGIDKTDTSMWDANIIGKVQWDETFDISSKEA